MRRLRASRFSIGVMAVALGLAGCGDHGEGRDTRAQQASASATPPAPETQPPATTRRTADGERPEAGPVARTAPERLPVPPRPPLSWLLLAEAPAGTGPEIALRFLRALQAGNDLAAARELSQAGRFWLAVDGPGMLHAVMRDVAAHARLNGAGACTSARQLNAEAALVNCGRTRVVVHVMASTLGSGVQIAPWHSRGDVVRGAHTHAFTSLKP